MCAASTLQQSRQNDHRAMTGPDPGRRRRHVGERQVRAFLLQDCGGLPDIPSPENPMPVASGDLRTERVHVVQNDQRGRCRQPLHIDEVTQGLLEAVQTVDEREFDRRVDNVPEVRSGEEHIAGLFEDPAGDWLRQIRHRVDADRASLRPHQREGQAQIDPDLQVVPGPPVIVNPAENVAVRRTGKQPLDVGEILLMEGLQGAAVGGDVSHSARPFRSVSGTQGRRYRIRSASSSAST
jgi:hypothetical protein